MPSVISVVEALVPVPGSSPPDPTEVSGLVLLVSPPVSPVVVSGGWVVSGG